MKLYFNKITPLYVTRRGETKSSDKRKFRRSRTADTGGLQTCRKKTGRGDADRSQQDETGGRSQGGISAWHPDIRRKQSTGTDRKIRSASERYPLAYDRTSADKQSQIYR